MPGRPTRAAAKRGRKKIQKQLVVENSPKAWEEDLGLEKEHSKVKVEDEASELSSVSQSKGLPMTLYLIVLRAAGLICFPLDLAFLI